MSTVSELVDELSDGKSLSAADRVTVEAYASLVVDMRAAQEFLEDLDVIVEGEEHPAVGVIAKCSREMRGWVERRPDLFGADASSGGRASGKAKFKQGLKVV